MFNTSLISVAATFGLSRAGVERKPRPFSLKYGKFQECTPVCVVQKAALTSDQKQEVLPILGSGMLFLLFPSKFWLSCLSIWTWWGWFYYPASRPPLPNPTLSCLFPKRLAFLGATSEAALEGDLAGSWVACCARAPGGGDNVLLIDWASWAEFRNLQKGVMKKRGWGMSWEGWRRRDDRIAIHRCFFTNLRFISVLFGRLKMVKHLVFLWLHCKGPNICSLNVSYLTFRKVNTSYQILTNWFLVFK